MNPLDPKPNDVFSHARFIDRDRTPTICRVTRVTKTTVWYRVGGGIGPATHRSDRSSFPQKVK